ncbi:MAG: hypothetical protein IT514_05160 [Burkholderiales bacterium]|nr:hypothetical protein [Burkholderiales bacterium]
MEVRWDAVVCGNPFGIAARCEPGGSTREGPVQIEVWLFGMLRGPGMAMPVRLEFPAAPTLRELAAELGRRLEPELAERLLAPQGGLYRYCRAFADGVQVESPDARVGAPGARARVEVIILTAAEGG